MASVSERQLQLAVLSVEKGLATAEQALGAASRWVADPSRSLAEHLALTCPARAEDLRLLEEELALGPGEGEDTLSPTESGRQPGAASANLSLVTPECPERYEFKSAGGKGGQARVYVVLDHHLGREVAWKELSPERSRDRDRDETEPPAPTTTALERFLREARVIGQLEHPGIVPVYELGRRPNGNLYYTMRLIRGRTLSSALKGKALPERLRLLGHLRDVCHALAFAHSRGVIHRDVKPANVMVGEYGETVLLDWGIAKVRGAPDARAQEVERRIRELSSDSGETMAGDALGTPSYMSPEQAEGRVEDIDERSDVWGLGALLYELLTGRPPFSGPTPLATVGMVAHQPLHPVRALSPAAPAELSAIAEKALSKRREDRYQGASEVAAELNAYMSGLRVSAYAYSSWELLRRFASRNKALLGSLAAVFVSVVAALVATQSALSRESAAHESEQGARAAETTQRKVARFHLAQAYQREAERLVAERRGLEARLFAAASLQQNPAHQGSLDFDPGFAAGSPEADWLRVDALSLLFQTRAQRSARLVATLPLKDPVSRVAFSPDGARLAATDQGGNLTIWAAEGLSRIASVQTAASLRALAFSPDGRLVFTGGTDRLIKAWDAATGAAVRTLPSGLDSILALATSPDGRRLACAGLPGAIELFDLESGQASRLAPGHADQVRSLAFSPDGSRLVSGSWDKTAVVWDLASRKALATLKGAADGVYAAAFSPDGRRVATASYDQTVRLWDAATGAALSSQDLHAEVYSVAFSPDGKRVAASDASGTVHLLDARTLSPELATRAHSSTGSFSVAFHPSGDLLASAGMDRTVRVWSRAEGTGPRLTQGDWVYGIAWSKDGRVLATGGWDHTLKLWNTATGALLETLPGHQAGISHLALGRDGRMLASSGYDSELRLWDLPSRKLVRAVKSLRGPVRASDFSPDGRLVAYAAAQGAAVVVDADSGKEVAVLEHPASIAVQGVAFSPDGRLLATASKEKTVRLWDTRTWTVVRRLEGHADWSSGLAWSPDGKVLASSAKDSLVILWDPSDGRILAKLHGHGCCVDDVTFSPDGKLLASSGDDSKVVVWDVATRQPLLRLRTSRETLRSRFSPDGATLAVADFTDVALYRLDLPFTVGDPAALLAEAQTLSGLTLQGFTATLAAPPAASP